MTARLYLTVYARDDMLGASLGTVDAWTELEFTDTLHGTGSGRVKIARHHPQADLLVQDRYVRVHSDAGVIGAFFLEQGTIDLSASEGTGDEWLEWIGRGPLAILETAVMDNDSDIVGGEDPIDGFWDLSNQGPLAGNSSAHPITMFKRAVVEAKLQTPTGLGGVDHSSFTYDEDSNGDPLVFIDGEWGVNVGDDLLTVLRKLDQIGGVTFRMSTDFELSAWLTYGTDRSGAFGAGNVRFEKAVNVATAIDRKVRGGVTRTHLIVGGADRVFVTVTDPDYTTGDVIRWGFLSVPESSNEDALESAGLAHIEARKRQTDVWVIPAHDHGDDEAAGIYEPGNHYFVGDTVTVHTGSGAYDANEVADVVASVTWKGNTGDEANEDYRVIVEIGSTFSWEANTGFDSNPGSQHGITLCQPGTVSDPTVLFRYTSLTSAMSANPAIDAGWDGGSTSPPAELTATPTDTRDGTLSSTNRVLRCFARFAFELDADTAPLIAAGGATILMHARARTRAGVGIFEAAQDMISEMGVRVTTGDSTTIRGTALPLSGLTSSAGSAQWNKSSTLRNMEWPAAAADNTLAAVSGTVSGDFLVVEVGYNNFTDLGEPSGGHIHFNDQPDAAGDLPADLTTTANLRSWVQISTPGTGAPNDGHPDLVGVDPHASRCDHRHDVHRDRAPTVEDDESLGYKLGTIWAQLDDLDTPTAIVGVWMLVDATDGAAVWLALASSGGGGGGTSLTIEEEDGTPAGTFEVLRVPNGTLTDNGDSSASLIFVKPIVAHGVMGAAEDFDTSISWDHTGTLDVNLTVTFSGAVSGTRSWLVLSLTQDGSGGNDITWPGSVVWPGGVAPTVDQTAGAVNLFSFFTDDAGTNWYGSYPGAGGSSVGALDDLTDVTVTAPAEDDDLRYNGSVWVNDPRKWEAVTDGEDVFVWESDDLVHEWST